MFQNRLTVLVIILFAVCVLSFFALQDTRSVFSSSELRFFELSENGLQIVPASCPSVPSNPDYPHSTCSGDGDVEQPLAVVVSGICSANESFDITISSPNSEYTDFPGLFGEFSNFYIPPSFPGTYVSSYVDTTINFPSADTPIGVNRAGASNNYLAQWTGYVRADYSETYTFYTQSDDGVSLDVNGVTIIDNWTNHGSTEDSGTIALAAGEWYPIALNFYENSGSSQIELRYSSPSVSKQIIPSTNLSYSNGPLYYLVYWGDGGGQERIPSTGTVEAAEEQIVSHTYTTSGDKSIQVRAIAENGIQSPWLTHDVTCNYNCSHATFCSGDNLMYKNDVCIDAFLQTCPYGCSSGSCTAAPTGSIDIQAGSTLLRPGNTVVITWSAADVTSCTVSEDNPNITDSWSCDGSACVYQSQTSSAISQQTTYTLSCTGIDDETYVDTVTVDVIPVFEEI